MSSSKSSSRSKKRKAAVETDVPTAAKSSKEKKVKKSRVKTQPPFEIFHKKMDEFMEANGYLGSVLVKGIETLQDNEDDDEIDTGKLSEKQVASLRHILITTNREQDLDRMEKLILGEQHGDGLLMFNTRFSMEIMESWYDVRKMVSKLKSPAKKFDLLFAYTFWLKRHDYWMHDNEGGMEELTKGLASTWKRLLKNSNEALGIDAEYTKPGIMELLAQFKKEAESIDMTIYPSLKFNYK